MLGIAQSLFQERFAKNPWGPSRPSPRPEWSFLQEILHAGIIGYIDLAIAQKLLQNSASADESDAALICHLSIASRKGHLCISVEDGRVIPSPKDLWEPTESDLNPKTFEPLFDRFQAMIAAGAAKTPLSDTIPCVEIPVYRQGPRYYLQRNWMLEKAFIDHFFPLLNQSSPGIIVDMDSVKKSVHTMVEIGELLQEQGDAVVNGCLHSFSMITGGPGTGKTHTAGVLLRTLWEGMDQESKKRCRFVLAAPTGKAAAQLEGSIRRAMQGVEGFPLVTGQTLHGLLGIGKRYRPGATERVISADILLVDESSMVDAAVMTELMQALKPGSRLIMLGDRFQLPPVELGSFFADLVVGLQSKRGEASCSRITELSRCLRAELGSIIDTANAVKNGDAAALMALLNPRKGKGESDGVKFVPLEENAIPKEIQRRLLTYALPHYPMIATLPDDPKTLIAQLNRFRILSPLRQGPLGVDALNAMFYAASLARMPNAPCVVVPIMIAANNQRLGLFNGEVGLLVRFQDGSKRDFALFESKGQGGHDKLRQIPALLLPKYEYAYCISVHKSQGSEFDHILMLLPEDSERFGREALYTGITRARQKLELWGKETTIQATLERQAIRHSGIF